MSRGAMARSGRALLLAVAWGAGCTRPPAASVPYRNEFAAPLGREWSSRGGGWQVVDGRLFNDGAHNVPLWLDAALPQNVRITFLAESRSEAVDLKCELFADGATHASGYVVILSGWNNQKSIIARLDEHGPVRRPSDDAALRQAVAADEAGARARFAERRETVERLQQSRAGHTYRLRLERQDHDLRFFVDEALHLEYFDPSPLAGPGHDRFAFNNWASLVYFDELLIEPLF